MAKKLDIPNADDEALVRSAQRGAMPPYEELVHRHRDKIYARAFSMLRNEDEALDISQEAWVKGWQRLKQFKHNASFTTWMTRICINLCLDFLRKRKRKPTSSLDQMEEESGGVERFMPVEQFNPTEKAEREELRAQIDEGMAKLSYEHRTVLILHEFEQLGYKEVSKAMHCSIGTVMSRLFYARRKLATLLISLKKERQK
jgi:RNA polymerase sigma-70 factor (ECF subfamily)|tara:strand:+ start:328 stop:930 length:603 start_codon:yes stop_codon:yes gene_type:complete